MCTVTYIPSGTSIFITSNRDEKIRRAPAVPPQVHEYGSGRIMYPRDGDAGGTWIAIHANGNAVVFLNGAFEAHKPAPPYRKSRGLILLDLIDHNTPYNCFLAVNLNNIEPFTAVIRDNTHMFECRWDGSRKHFKEIDATLPQIWSSATLYNDLVISERNKWFEQWISDKPVPSQEDILHFHQFTGEDDTENGLRMNRDGKVFTVSITSIQISPRGLGMNYLDLTTNESFSGQILAETSMTGRG